MAGVDKKNASVNVFTNQQILEVAQNASKGVSEISKIIASIQKSAEDNVSKAASMMIEISNNAERIGQVEHKTSQLDNEVKENKDKITSCMDRLALLESKHRIAREIDDQESKIRSLQRRISPQEMLRASCFIALHGVPLPKEGLSSEDLSTAIAEMISKALGNELAQFIFHSKEQTLTNIDGWFRLPDAEKQMYNKATPSTSRNTIIFATRNRVQAVLLETKIRGALVATRTSRSMNNFSHLEIGFYAESQKVKALYKMLLYKGRLVTGAVEQLSHYRVNFRGGARRGAPESPPRLILEFKADREYINRRHEYFFKDEVLIRNVWTEDSNVLLSDLANLWFPTKPQKIQEMENKIEKVSKVENHKKNPTPSTPISCTTTDSEKRRRESPGEAGNKSKDAHLDPDVILEVEDGGEEEVLTTTTTTAALVEVTRTENLDGTEEEDEGNDFSPSGSRKQRQRKEKLKNKNKTEEEKQSAFPALTPLNPGSQMKISSVFQPTKKHQSKAGGLPIPKMIK